MTLDDYRELCRYWADHPPAQMMIQSYLGIKPRSKQPKGPALKPFA
jgi:hypothetical protein